MPFFSKRPTENSTLAYRQSLETAEPARAHAANSTTASTPTAQPSSPVVGEKRGLFGSKRHSVPATTAAAAPEPVVVEEKGMFGKRKHKTMMQSPDGTLHRDRSHSRSPSGSPVSGAAPVAAGNTTDAATNGVHHPVSPTRGRPGEPFSPTVLHAAREKLKLAEEAEARALKALEEAKIAVTTAKQHVIALEQEAILQAKNADLAARDAHAKLAEVDVMKRKTSKMGRTK